MAHAGKEGEAGALLFEALTVSQLVCRRAASGKEAIIRCPYCGDSQKSARSGHMYVHLRVPFKYFCHKCNAGGILTPSVLRDLGVFDDRVVSAARAAEKEAGYRRSKVAEPAGPKSMANAGMEVPPAGSSAWEGRGLEYVNGRLGTEITAEQARSRYRICFGLSYLLDHNRVEELHMSDREEKELLPKIDRYGVGFLSADRGVIDFRSRDVEQTGFRYSAYDIAGTGEHSKSYAVASRLDLCSETLRVVLAEGGFDLIGIHQHLYGGKSGGAAFLASGGKHYGQLLLGLVRMGFLHLDVHVYSDSELGAGYYAKAFGHDERLACQRYTLHYNSILGEDGKSDWGVRRDQIRDTFNELRIDRRRK
jgi:hypothetical protein